MTAAPVGHNTIAGDQLRAFLDRIERLTEEKKTIQDDISDVYKEAKGVGFDTKAMRRVMRLRLMDKAKREEELQMTELYLHAAGLL